ncbi:MAG TPA: hypothetical protein VMW55_07605 [Nitrosopumilaceae archaeon]|nr:hypothetical protein [Nitrosopumilaceae archaeon]
MEKAINKISNQSQIVQHKSTDQKLSFCRVMKDNTLDLIQKLESETPSLFQNYSDLYTRYLHSIKDLYATCSLAENQYFESMDVDQNFLKLFDGYFKYGTKVLESQIDMSTKFLSSYIEFRLSIIDSWDKYAHELINKYAESLSQILQRKMKSSSD